MNKSQFDKLLKPLIDIYDEIELDMIKNILTRVENYKSVQGTLEWLLEKLSELNLLDKDNLKVLKSHKGEIEAVLTEIATTSGHHINDLDILNSYFEQGLITVNPNQLFESVSVNNLIREALKDTNDIMELINTKALEGAKEGYKKVLNKAYIETASGIYTYSESIRKALDEFAKEGIQTVHYESGKTLSIESVVRRDVITRMNKLAADCELEHCKELETNLVYVSQHLGARVRTKYMTHDYEAHVEWQGKKYMIEGFNDKYDNLYEKTGYGEMLGLAGINCYHHMRPTWEWEKVPDRIDEKENAKEYALRQKQRAFERKIRSLKRERTVAKSLGNNEDYKKYQEKYKKVNQSFDEWLKENNRTRDYSREYVSNKKYPLHDNQINNNDLISVVDDDEKYLNPDLLKISNEVFEQYKKNGFENVAIIDSQTNKRLGKINTSGEVSRVDYSEEQKEIMKQHVNDLYSLHNHPGEHTFSMEDIEDVFKNECFCGSMVCTETYNYYFMPKKEDLSITKQNFYEFNEWMNKEMAKINDKHFTDYAYLNQNDKDHLIYKELFQKIGWIYGREKK